MEKKLIVAIMLLIVGLLGLGHLIQPTNFETFRNNSIDSRRQQFEEFQWKYSKVYNNIDEEDFRFQLFNETSDKIEKFNQENDDIKVAMNQFGDLTDEEYSSLLVRKNNPIYSDDDMNNYPSITNRPRHVNWIGKLVNTEVYDQASCGSCWAHSATESVEGVYAKQNGKIQRFSIQELVDCVYPSKDTCVDGGLEYEGMQWVQKYGQCKNDDYPRQYSAKQYECQASSCTPVDIKIKKVIHVPSANVESVLDYLAIAPISMALNAKEFQFRYYSSGIIKGSRYEDELNHAVLGVAYSESDNYIKVKNSYGPGWGESGYFRVQITKGYGPLGIYEDCSMAIGEDY